MGIILNWLALRLCQELDTSERLFYLTTEMILLLAVIAVTAATFPVGWILALVLAHTLTWLISQKFYFQYSGFSTSDPRKFAEYIEKLRKRNTFGKYIAAAAILGSFARLNLKPTSDLDLWCIHRNGLTRGFLAAGYALLERFRAMNNGVALDMPILDSVSRISRELTKKEKIVVVHDPDNILREQFDLITFEEFVKKIHREREVRS